MRPLVLAALGVMVGAAAAHAGEDDRALSVSLSYGSFIIPDHDPDGAVLGLDYERGLSEAISLRASAGGGVYYEGGAAYSGHLTAGITYLFDVLKYVPYANLGVGGIVVTGDGIDTDVEPLIELGLGLDVLQSRSFSYGVQARFETFASRTSFFTAGVRLTWRWGFF